MTRRSPTGWVAAGIVRAVSLMGRRNDAPVEAARYLEPDSLFSLLLEGVNASSEIVHTLDIDHSRLAGGEGVAMPPSHVLMVSQPLLEAMMVHRHQLLGLELPLRALAYEESGGEAAVLYNRWENIAARHSLVAPELAERFDRAMSQIVKHVPAQRLRTVPIAAEIDAGIVTFTSAHDFETTLTRARAVINAQEDAVWFGEIDFQARASELGMELRPSLLLLFGGPDPGGRAMAGAPTLGLNAFCQKVLIWQGDDGQTRISFNDLLVLAKRQNAASSIALRVILFRLKSAFEQVAATG